MPSSSPPPLRLPLPPPRPRSAGTTDTEEAARYFREGAAAHAAGRLDEALAAFERACALAPAHPNAASACAAVLGQMGRHRAAWAVLQPAGEALWGSADGAFNLGSAAEQGGLEAQADAAYAHALELQPDHVRALNNSALRQARAGRPAEALAALQRCVQLAPQWANLWSHWADLLLATGDAQGALRILAQAAVRHPRALVLAVRQAVAAACAAASASGLAAAQARLRGLPAAAGPVLHDCLRAAGLGADAFSRQAASPLAEGADTRDAALLLLRHALRQRWDAERCAHTLAPACDTLGSAAATPGGTQAARTPVQAAELLALAQRLPLPEALRQRLRERLAPALPGDGGPGMRPFELSVRGHADGRLRIGFALSDIPSPQAAQALAAALGGHHAGPGAGPGAGRFVFHVYAATVPPDPARSALLRQAGIAVVELAHMHLAERVERIRLDGLDILHDLCDGAPWCLPLGRYRMARVQLHHPARSGLLAQEAWDYLLLPQTDATAAAVTAPAGAWLRVPAGPPHVGHDTAAWARTWEYLAARAHQGLPPLPFDATAA
jgi:tetratricopeptide (TPR) repeat protein